MFVNVLFWNASFRNKKRRITGCWNYARNHETAASSSAVQAGERKLSVILQNSLGKEKSGCKTKPVFCAQAGQGNFIQAAGAHIPSG